ncbi:MAG TPA: alpha-amylase [Cyanobacteria bacterium UBA11162]|nr:alpha-amylase [Cyanobacteria bacterium UBA11162]
MAAPIEFTLFAPYNQGASLIGSFSNWEEVPMKKTEDGYFRASVELEDGVYQYKFRVQSKSWFFEPDQWVEVNDPYATDIDNPTQNSVVRIKDGERIVDTYVWQHDDKPLPPDRELVIYEMHVGDFSGGEDDPYARGKYKHVIEKLDYLCELGVNAIELMPVKEYPGDYSWGYNPRYFFATESSYGPTEGLKRLIDECHARGIRIIMDGIYNHSEAESPLTQIDHDYWYHHSPRDPDNNWGPEFNYEHFDENLQTYPARKFIGDTVRFWIEEYHIDGIRYDAARQIANYDFMHWIVQEAKKTAGIKPFYNIAEHIPETTSITNVDGPMDGCWHDSFYHFVQPILCGESFDLEQLMNVLYPKRQGYPEGISKLVNYITNHDQERLIRSLGDAGIFDDEAFKRVKLGAILLMTAPGIPMIWMGQEFGEYKNREPNQPKKLEWDLLKNERNRDLFEFYKGIIAFRKQNSALKSTQVDFIHANPEGKVLAYGRSDGEESQVIVVANFSDQSFDEYQITDFPNGNWQLWGSDRTLEITDNQLTLELPANEAQIFVLQ